VVKETEYFVLFSTSVVTTEDYNVIFNSEELIGRVETECDGTRKRMGGEVKGKKANGGGSQQSCTVSDTVYPALLPLMRTPRLPAAD